MTTLAWALLGVTVLVAGLDWFAVATENRTLEYVFKPATMVALGGVALALTPAVPSMRPWFLAAVVLSMLGDIFLMLPNENLFVAGLGSFLFGHLAYIAGMINGGTSTMGLVVGGVIVFTGLVALAPTIIKGAKDHDRALAIPVAVYIGVIGVMVTCAAGTGVWIGIVGAVFFLGSDFTIGWSRFVSEFPQSRMVIITTYHLGQILLVLSLVPKR